MEVLEEMISYKVLREQYYPNNCKGIYNHKPGSQYFNQEHLLKKIETEANEFAGNGYIVVLIHDCEIQLAVDVMRKLKEEGFKVTLKNKYKTFWSLTIDWTY